MAEPTPPLSQSSAQTPPPPQQQTPTATVRDDMIACVAALLPCLPARELQAVDRSLQSTHENQISVDVERHARDLMEATKKLPSYFISLQREDQPTNEEMLRKTYNDLKLLNLIVKSNEETIKSLKKEVSELKQESDQLRQDKNELKDERDQLKKERDQLNKQINQMNYERDDLSNMKVVFFKEGVKNKEKLRNIKSILEE